jgi:hypothetical protein
MIVRARCVLVSRQSNPCDLLSVRTGIAVAPRNTAAPGMYCRPVVPCWYTPHNEVDKDKLEAQYANGRGNRERMVKRSKLSLLVSLVATTLLAAGCGQTSANHSSTTANANSSAGSGSASSSSGSSSSGSSGSSTGSSGAGSSGGSSSGSAGSSSGAPVLSGNDAQFVKDDTTTQGNWPSGYGADGYSLAGSAQSLPSYATFNQSNASVYTWATNASDARAVPVPGAGKIAASWYGGSFSLNTNFSDGNTHLVALYAMDYDGRGRAETIQIVDPMTSKVLDSQVLSNFSNGVYLLWYVSGQVKINITFTAGPNAVISGIFFGTGGTTIASAPPSGSGSGSACPPAINSVTFIGIDSTTQGAWKGTGNFNAPPASSSLVYGKDGDVLPDTENCDTGCNPFPSYVSFGPQCVNSATAGNIGAKPYSTHAYVALVQGSSGVMGAEPQNATNTAYFQCNYTFSNAAAPSAPMVAWRPVVDTREISNWYTCSGITSYYLEFSFGNGTHNFEVYAVDDQNGGTQFRSEELQVLDGDTNAVLFDSGAFTNFTGGLYYKWSISGHVKVKLINTSTNGTNAVINGAFFN